MKFWEIRCNDCGARFNPPDEYYNNHSDVRKYIPVNIKTFRKYAIVVGKPIEYEEIWSGGNKIYRKYLLTSTNDLDSEWEYDNGSYIPKYIRSYERYKNLVSSGILKVSRIATIDEYAKDHDLYSIAKDIHNKMRFIKTHQIIKNDNDIVIYANKHERITGSTVTGKYVQLLDLHHIDKDKSYCYTYYIEAEDFKVIAMRANITIEEESEFITHKLLCPECGKICITIKKRK